VTCKSNPNISTIQLPLRQVALLVILNRVNDAVDHLKKWYCLNNFVL